VSDGQERHEILNDAMDTVRNEAEAIKSLIDDLQSIDAGERAQVRKHIAAMEAALTEYEAAL